jgi:glycosyltransferase involved in cell wall biosynthesis
MRFSIVVPNLNQARFLGEALESVIGAGRGLDVECIVIDGGSTDGSVDVIGRYGSRLASWSSEVDQGQYEAINKGFARSTGEIMGWLNSDDFYLPWTFRTVHSIFATLPQVEWLTSNRPGIADEEATAIRFRVVPGYARQAFADGRYLPVDDGVSFGCIQQESTFWRRSLWEKSGGQLSASLCVAADFELWSRFFSFAELHSTDVPLAAFRTRAGQRSADVEAYLREVEQVTGRPRPVARAIRQAARIPALRALVKKMSRYSAPVINGDANSEWRVARIRFG